jgi:hypothetical protein
MLSPNFDNLVFLSRPRPKQVARVPTDPVTEYALVVKTSKSGLFGSGLAYVSGKGAQSGQVLHSPSKTTTEIDFNPLRQSLDVGLGAEITHGSRFTLFKYAFKFGPKCHGGRMKQMYAVFLDESTGCPRPHWQQKHDSSIEVFYEDSGFVRQGCPELISGGGVYSTEETGYDITADNVACRGPAFVGIGKANFFGAWNQTQASEGEGDTRTDVSLRRASEAGLQTLIFAVVSGLKGQGSSLVALHRSARLPGKHPARAAESEDHGDDLIFDDERAYRLLPSKDHEDLAVYTRSSDADLLEMLGDFGNYRSFGRMQLPDIEFKISKLAAEDSESGTLRVSANHFRDRAPNATVGERLLQMFALAASAMKVEADPYDKSNQPQYAHVDVATVAAANMDPAAFLSDFHSRYPLPYTDTPIELCDVLSGESFSEFSVAIRLTVQYVIDNEVIVTLHEVPIVFVCA